MKKLVLFLCGVCGPLFSYTQINYQPYSFQHYQNYAKAIYADSLRHTAVKPFVGGYLNPQQAVAAPDTTKSWLHRKLFQEHLIQVKKEDHTFFADFMPDFIIGKQTGTNSKTLWTNTRGAQVGLSIKDKFSFYLSFYENQARFPTHIDTAAMAIGGLPGQGFSKNVEQSQFDWMNATANLTYAFSSAFNLTLAYDKVHIGDGYRSVLLSESPYNYTHAKFSGNVGRFQYNSIWATMLDRKNFNATNTGIPEIDRQGDGAKFAAFQYVDYLIDEKAAIGLFHSLIWPKSNDPGADKVNGGLGLNGKYQPWSNVLFYGQVYADDLSKFSFNRNADRRVAYQLGGRAFDVFAVNNLNVTLEYNQAAPYTYQHRNNRINYTVNGEPLAHPAGANFREILGMLTYTWNRWNVYGQSMFSRYGVDPDGDSNYGRDLFKETSTTNQFLIGQGQTTNLFYNELRLAYVLNPTYNLRFELGMINRRQHNLVTTERINANMFTIGLRSSFRAFQTEY
ncbi:gliding motility protein RemB [Sphingobacterium oryzagri]|uniref:Gliding motility protein RemB n=1 Tax=Sphingobacterium oryzagri TaxID=3025669 RepID=A0ABY7WK50_9SPHI|nr:gliding motility protein RemB [Sphingobacterium sp. KACC 22765]WDF68979.1 gliding motility protein RemB [Sphingobacterium sp. KACC 22765]